jgi:3-ketosteroid 9alpha-monooxygenase subunit B
VVDDEPAIVAVIRRCFGKTSEVLGTISAREAGLNPLSSCEEGFCASCAAKRIKGKVLLAKNDIYTPDDLANDWILTCQGHCFGAEVEITYDVV